MAIGRHKVLYFLVESDCVLWLVSCQIKVPLLLHAVEEHVLAWADVLHLVHNYGLGLSVKCSDHIVGQARLYNALLIPTAAEELIEFVFSC